MYVSENDKRTFRCILLLNDIFNAEKKYTAIERNSSSLKSVFDDLILQKSIEIGADGTYGVTDSGGKVFDTFMNRYTEYLKFYEAFAYVDTGTGEFGLASYFDKSEEDWNKYVQDPRFEDMRIAVALFKKINPSEIIFMSFIKEDTVTLLSSDAAFGLIEEIIATAIKPGGDVNDAFMEDMIKQGADLVVKLLVKEKELDSVYQAELNAATSSITTTTTTTTTVEEEEDIDDYDYYDPYYYECYYDPFWISPIWADPLFYW